ncbi:MAG: UvrD-helicase domain-containing protein [Ignavibacteriaceae bacterium]
MNALTDNQIKALNFKNHIALTANAGSGKTFVLANRYLEIALKENISLRNIAAITFTEKAAGELYKKIASEIGRRLSENSDIRERIRLEEIRQQLVSANISTIHSFCLDILREYPVEAKLDSNFVPVDEKVSSELIELAIEEAIKNALNVSDEESNMKYLARYFSSKKNLSNQIGSLIRHRKNVLVISKNIYCQEETEISKFFFDSFMEYSEKIFSNKIENAINLIRNINNAVLDLNIKNPIALSINNLLIENLSLERFWDRLLMLLKIKILMTTKTGSLKINGYLGKHFIETFYNEVNQIEEIFSELEMIMPIDNHEEIETELAYFGKRVINIFNNALEIYSNRKKENGYLDYEDILLFTQDILKINSVRKDLSDKFKYLLIDEYQDTNETQYNIFLPILEDLQKGNLFVVGDEKQSIYMFRDAELEVFNRTKKSIREIEGDASLLSLPDSFRMAPELSLFINSLFKKLFNNPDKLFNEVEHSDLVCALNDGIQGRVEVLIPKINPNIDQSSNLPQFSESEIVTRKILELIGHKDEQLKINWGDIAVLCRKRKSFIDLEKCFIRYGVPFQIVGGKDFYKRQTIYDIYNYFAFLLDEGNDAALTGILRSPFLSLSDSQIFGISLQNGKTLWEKVKNYISVNKQFYQTLQPIIEIKNGSGNSDFITLLRKIINGSNFLSVIASRPDGVQELANIQKLIQLTNNYNSQGFKTIYDYVTYLKESIEQSHEEAQASISDDANSVKIMTLHQAKGLEFPVVFLFNSGDSKKSDSTKSKSITISKDFGLLAKLPLNEKYFDEYISAPIIGINNLITYKKNIAEVKRLLYVGVTRAKYYLFISATPVKDMSFSKESFMGLLQHGLDINFHNENYLLESNLTFLIAHGDRFLNVTKPLSLNIPVRNEIDIILKDNFGKSTCFVEKNLLLSIIKDQPSQEIISASKFSIYYQCQMKYSLTYGFGLNEIMDKILSRNLTAKKNNFEFKIKNEENEYESNYNLSMIKGNIIHKLLEIESIPSTFEKHIESIINEEIKTGKITAPQATELKYDIIKQLIRYYSSDSYKQINAFSNYKNEFEIFVEEEKHLLYGIIDKIIFDGNKIIIVDYKTDEITENEIRERSQIYLNQMKFYSYIVSKLFPDFTKLELKLLFLEIPTLSIDKVINTSDLNEIKNQLISMIENSNGGNFVKNTNHCSKCKFSINYSHCIKN